MGESRLSGCGGTALKDISGNDDAAYKSVLISAVNMDNAHGESSSAKAQLESEATNVGRGRNSEAAARSAS